MNDAKYSGLDAHPATISAAVLDSDGRLTMESILETKAATVLQFMHGLRGSLHITFGEGLTQATLSGLLCYSRPHRGRHSALSGIVNVRAELLLRCADPQRKAAAKRRLLTNGPSEVRFPGPPLLCNP